MAGKFITFEGGEGAGKTTQIRRLAERLDAHRISTVVTREPGGTPKAEAIRDFILSGGAAHLGADGEAILFAAARADHVEQVIKPALAAGKWVLCDRFSDSTRAYQGGKDGADADLLARLEEIAVAETRPDLTLILDLPAQAGLARAGRRQSSEGQGPDRFEREDLDIHEARRRVFLDIAAENPKRCVIVDATADVDGVAEQVWRAVASRLLAEAA